MSASRLAKLNMLYNELEKERNAWKELFYKYMELVAECEGVDFLARGKWTENELKMINELGREKESYWIEIK